jgi:hypothetical protein
MSEASVSRRSLLRGAGIAGVAGLAVAAPMAALAPGVAQASREREGADALVGTWRGTVTTQGQPSFEALTTFVPGGTLVASASIDLTPPNVSSPSYGVWARGEDSHYSVRFLFFTFDAKNNPAGTGEVKAALTLDDDDLTGSFTLTIFDPTGAVVFTTPGTISATRVEID